MALLPAIAGRVRGCFLPTGNGVPNFSQKFSQALHHQCSRNPQQPYPQGFQIIFFRGVFTHLVGLRVNSSVQFDRQPVFETIEINDPVFDPALAAELGAQPSATQEVPGRSFSVGLAAPQFAKALGWEM